MIFVDTGPFIARAIEHDEHFDLATDAWTALEKKPLPLFTSTLVVSELLTYLRRHTRGRLAESVAEALFASRLLTILRPAVDIDIEALALFRRHRDRRSVSWTDCVSFALMKRNKIRRAFSFDADFFDIAGFDRWPR